MGLMGCRSNGKQVPTINNLKQIEQYTLNTHRLLALKAFSKFCVIFQIVVQTIEELLTKIGSHGSKMQVREENNIYIRKRSKPVQSVQTGFRLSLQNSVYWSSKMVAARNSSLFSSLFLIFLPLSVYIFAGIILLTLSDSVVAHIHSDQNSQQKIVSHTPI